MVFPFSVIRRRRREPQRDPLAELGITVYEYTWLNRRVQAVREIVDYLEAIGRPNYVWGVRQLLSISAEVVIPWARGSRRHRRPLEAWIRLARLVMDHYRVLAAKGYVREVEECLGEGEGEVCLPVLEGPSAEALNTLASRVYDDWFLVFYDVFNREDVGVSKVFLVQGPGAGPDIRDLLQRTMVLPGALPGPGEERKPREDYNAYEV